MKLSSTNSISFELTITGYEFPDLETDYDADWLNIRTKVVYPLASWLAEFPCLFTYEVEWLARWLEKVASSQASDETCFFTEPNLEFSVFSQNDGEMMLRVNLSHEMAPPSQQPKDNVLEGISIDFQLKELNLHATTQSLREALTRYPPRGAHALWLTSEAYYRFQPLFAQGIKARAAGKYREAIASFEQALEAAKKLDKVEAFTKFWREPTKNELTLCHFRLSQNGVEMG